jgi:hypothetical protein
MISPPESLVPQRLSHIVKAISYELRSRNPSDLCVTFSYGKENRGKLVAILPSLQPDIAEQVKSSLVSCADIIERKFNFVITDITTVQKSAWLSQLLGMTPLDEEVRASLDSPAIFGRKPSLTRLLDVLFADVPLTPEEIRRWLRKKLIEPTEYGYEFTVKGLKAIRFQARVHWRPIREHLKIGHRILHVIAA